MKKGFFAYSSTPEYCGEFIEDAIKEINDTYSSLVQLQSWIYLRSTGRLIISEIFKEIDSCDFFCADLTGVNDNVLFELGYAIALKKPIWLILDKSHIESVRKFQELSFFTTVGYRSYTSSKEIVQNFSKDLVYESEVSLLDSLTNNIPEHYDENALLYIKSQYDTSYSQDIINEINLLNLPYILDDSVESKIHPLTWYIEKITSVPSTLIEFSSIHRFGFELHNSKCSFIGGLSVGLGLRTLLVSEKPYYSPLDYRELLLKYSTRSECQESVRPYLKAIQNDIAKLLLRKRSLQITHRDRTELQKINFGEFIAEHESDNLINYYIETSHYQNLIKSEHNIVIGRKGTGKTATLYFLERALSKDVRNHVCLIKPVNFEIDGLVSLFNKMTDDFEKGFLVESIWKFLIYSEISKSLYEKITKKNTFTLTNEELHFKEFVEKHHSLIMTDFSTRLEEQIESLFAISVNSQGEFKIKVSEILHDSIIKELRNHIVKIINKSGKLVVLIDNLDKSWRKDSNVRVLSKYILGLLGVVGRIAKEFHGPKGDPYKFSFHLTLFLRSDIFKFIIDSAREPDKIEYTRLSWNDPETLFRIIETRFEELTSFNVSANELWTKYIAEAVNGVPVKQFMSQNVFPRPRDIIYFLTSAKNLAVSRGHGMITKEDLISAYYEYSSWVFKSVIVENGITVKQMEEFMYNLMGEKEILLDTELIDIALKSKILLESEESKIKFIDHLVSLTIVGREVKSGKFDYEYEFDNNIKLKALAGKLKTNRFKIHNALVPYLELSN